MEKLVKVVKVGKGKAPLHQGIMKLLFYFEKKRRGIATGPFREGFQG